MSVKLNLIKELLQEAIDKIDSGTSNKSDEELDEIVKFLTKMNRGVKRISKYQACKDILHCSQSTFNLYLGLGIIPQDKVFVANMCKADYLNSSIPDEKYLAKYIKDVLDDVDGYEGIAFCRWLADVKHKGVNINWEQMI